MVPAAVPDATTSPLGIRREWDDVRAYEATVVLVLPGLLPKSDSGQWGMGPALRLSLHGRSVGTSLIARSDGSMRSNRSLHRGITSRRARR
jgi:hypothetical protein